MLIKPGDLVVYVGELTEPFLNWLRSKGLSVIDKAQYYEVLSVKDVNNRYFKKAIILREYPVWLELNLTEWQKVLEGPTLTDVSAMLQIPKTEETCSQLNQNILMNSYYES